MSAFFTLFDTEIGRCGLAWGPRGVLSLQLPEKSEAITVSRLKRAAPNAAEAAPDKAMVRLIADIQSLLQGQKRTLRAAVLDMAGVPAFHARVYETARAIPHGHTRSYGDIARAIGQANGARAVGQALGRNPFALIVPCHRVVGANGAMVGFSANGGVDMKTRLLAIEGVKPAPSLFDAL